ncbi:MAG: NAD-binding protein [Candidatus Latescibacteria bacterium]|nr:NAD-binding protein [Candidatus Latescibacterota bacterium]
MGAHIGEDIGLIGLGLVGSALAWQLLDGGYGVVGCDIDSSRAQALEEMGGTAVDKPAAVARRCRRVVLSLMSTDIVRQVVEGENGVLAEDQPPAYIIDTTTGDPEQAAALGQRLGWLGIDYLDATISGSSQQIGQRQGTFMVGGGAEVFAANRDLLAVFSDRVYHLGPVGSGSRAKLASNLVLGLNRLALAEGLVFAGELGLDLDAFLEVLKNSPAYSVAVDTKGQRMIEGDFIPESRIRQHLKDVELMLEYARRAGLRLPLSQVHRTLLTEAVAAGDGELDNAAVIRRLGRGGD